MKSLNFKCYFGFHDYIPIEGLYWRYDHTDHRYIPNGLAGVHIIKLYKCRRCGNIVEETIEYYPCESNISIGFNVNDVVKSLEKQGIRHIKEYYA